MLSTFFQLTWVSVENICKTKALLKPSQKLSHWSHPALINFTPYHLTAIIFLHGGIIYDKNWINRGLGLTENFTEYTDAGDKRNDIKNGV